MSYCVTQGRIKEFLTGGEGGGGAGGGGGGEAIFGSESTVELFCGKLLLTKTTTCLSICERQSPLAWERLLCEQWRTDQRRVPKNNHILNIPGI